MASISVRGPGERNNPAIPRRHPPGSLAELIHEAVEWTAEASQVQIPRRSALCCGALALAAFAAEDSRACSPEDFASLSQVRAQAASPAAGRAAAAGAWSTRGALSLARQEVAVAELDGRIYVVGGIDATPAFLASVEVYDPDDDSFSSGPALPVPLHHTTATAVAGKLYVIGGWSDFFATPLDSVYELDPQVGSWVAKSAMPTARGSPAAAALAGRIYVAGGWPSARARDFAVYEPATDSWQTLPDLPSGRNHLALAAAGGRIYAVGGRTDLSAGVGNVASVDAYDPQSGLWSSAAPLPRARGGLAAVGHRRFVFAFGGEGNAASPDGTFEDADVYDTRLDVWAALDPLPTPRHGIGAAVLAGAIHVPGGGPVQNFSVSDVHEVMDVAAALGLSVPLLPLAGGIGLAGALLLAARRATIRLR
jgi:N-acetylneuraminic acid mutarotase